MIPEAQKDVLNALKEVVTAIKENRFVDLHAISDHVLHAITIYQDIEIVDVAIITYALDKIFAKEKYKKHKKIKQFVKTILYQLQNAIANLEKENYESYSNILKEIFSTIEDFSKSIKLYIEDVMHFARIKKGTKLYEHGLSLGKAAELTQVSKWELMPAIGETAIHEQFTTSKRINERRIEFAKKLFKRNKKKS
jgi:gas vesicle protein